MNNNAAPRKMLYKTATVVICIAVAIITVIWVVFSIGAVLQLTYQYGWWAVVVLVLFAMWILNIIYFIWALPSLLIHFFKSRNRNLNVAISAIYLSGLLASIATPWFVMDGITVPKCIIATIADVLLIIFYTRKISELFEYE